MVGGKERSQEPVGPQARCEVGFNKEVGLACAKRYWRLEEQEQEDRECKLAIGGGDQRSLAVQKCSGHGRWE